MYLKMSWYNFRRVRYTNLKEIAFLAELKVGGDFVMLFLSAFCYCILSVFSHEPILQRLVCYVNPCLKAERFTSTL